MASHGRFLRSKNFLIVFLFFFSAAAYGDNTTCRAIRNRDLTPPVITKEMLSRVSVGTEVGRVSTTIEWTCTDPDRENFEVSFAAFNIGTSYTDPFLSYSVIVDNGAEISNATGGNNSIPQGYSNNGTIRKTNNVTLILRKKSDSGDVGRYPNDGRHFVLSLYTTIRRPNGSMYGTGRPILYVGAAASPPGGGGTCRISVGDTNKSVALPSVKTSDFLSVGSVAGATAFSITVEECSTSVRSARFTFSGTAAPNNSDYFANTGTASGVALRLTAQRSGAVVTPTGSAASVTEPISTELRRGSLSMVANYARTGTMNPGTLRSIATVTINYQ
ncbi:fimbrial protein [Herbaspirillum chlorophenolicum]|uniref:fimbrial protein n=1 Tax=Herbaspirillum chlorophenolicum TaxID=211589 RepID=UPI000B333CA1|nr:fimbrial protein [Herbaspirillum chlorophenolicum]